MREFKDFIEKYGLEMVSAVEVEDNPHMYKKGNDDIHYLITIETSKASGSVNSMEIFFTTGSMFGEVSLEDVLYTIGMDMGYYLDDYGIGEYIDEFGIDYNQAKSIDIGIRWNSGNFIAMFDKNVGQELFEVAIEY